MPGQPTPAGATIFRRAGRLKAALAKSVGQRCLIEAPWIATPLTVSGKRRARRPIEMAISVASARTWPMKGLPSSPAGAPAKNAAYTVEPSRVVLLRGSLKLTGRSWMFRSGLMLWPRCAGPSSPRWFCHGLWSCEPRHAHHLAISRQAQPVSSQQRGSQGSLRT
jgi:hypothetical protein